MAKPASPNLDQNSVTTTRSLTFKVVCGPVDDFVIAPNPKRKTTVKQIRENAINACVERFKAILEKEIRADESLIQWNLEPLKSNQE